MRSKTMHRAIAALGGLSGLFTSFAAVAKPADFVVRHAIIYTADARRSMATGLAVRDGKIVFVGSDGDLASWVGPATKVRDAGGRCRATIKIRIRDNQDQKVFSGR